MTINSLLNPSIGRIRGRFLWRAAWLSIPRRCPIAKYNRKRRSESEPGPLKNDVDQQTTPRKAPAGKGEGAHEFHAWSSRGRGGGHVKGGM